MAEPASPADIASVLALDHLGGDRFRWTPPPPGGEGFRLGLFGGQPLAVGLLAAGATVGTDREPHSLHAYFLRPGEATVPLDMYVDRDTDGRSFSARRVTVSQDGRVIFSMAASFHLPEDGPDTHVDEMPTGVRLPEDLPPSPMGVPRGEVMEVRNVGNRFVGRGMPTRAWGRAAGPIDDSPLLNAAVLVHFSDIYTGMPALPGTNDNGGPSLDHAFWFHRPSRMDDWVLMDLEPISSGRGRALYRGSFFDRHGTLLATMGQEILYSTSRPARSWPGGEAGPSAGEWVS